jgi:lysyl-tRNA synthetase class 2
MHFHLPEYHHQEEFQNRSAKLTEIKNLGIDPYPHTFHPTAFADSLHRIYHEQPIGHSEDAAAGSTPEMVLGGRLVLFRSMGKNAFAHLQDSTGRIQLMFNRDLTKVHGYHPDPNSELSAYKFIEKKIDLGDIIGVKGNLFRSQKGELTLFVKEVTLLCKTLLPLPDKHSGLVDKGVRYRKRWLDLITHHDVVETFQMRSRILHIIRKYFEKNGFLEVETPVLQNVYGGAQAKPFITKLNALDQEMFLRISLEIPLKKLIVGGLSKVFEIGKVFRNEGLDRTHNPEFTELEAYAAYADYNDMMVLTEKLFEDIALELFRTTKLTLVDTENNEVTIDLKAPWIRLSMKDSIKKYGNVNVDQLSNEEMTKILLEQTEIDPKKVKGASRGTLISLLFEELVESHLIQPHHIIDHPIETTPLCKLHRDPELRKEHFVERFESFILGGEFCNSYTELNDPELQRKLLVEQAEKRLAGDEEATPLDEEFIEAICQGMPPTGGLGIGIDRMVMLFTKVPSIRDVLYFPIMKPEE